MIPTKCDYCGTIDPMIDFHGDAKFMCVTCCVRIRAKNAFKSSHVFEMKNSSGSIVILGGGYDGRKV